MKTETIRIKTFSTDQKGSLSFFEADRDIPFNMKRLYYIYGAPKGTRRGGHAHKSLDQILVCVHGSIEVILDDGASRKTVILNDPSEGLIVRKMIWHDMVWHQNDSILIVGASNYYEESDYIRLYEEFSNRLNAGNEESL